MATWSEVKHALSMVRGEWVNDEVWKGVFQGATPERGQQVFVIHEAIPPALELVQIKAAIEGTGQVDLNHVIPRFGGMLAGAFSYTSYTDPDGKDRGILNFSTVLPLGSLSVSQPTDFLLYLHVFARAADTLEQQLAVYGAPDMF